MARITVFTDYYLPSRRAGGTVTGLETTVRQLRSHSVRIYTRDRDIGSLEPYLPPYVGSILKDGARITYIPAAGVSGLHAWATALATARRGDSVLLNSFQSPTYTILPLLALRLMRYRGRVVIAPRGELNPQARAQKALKKRLWRHALEAMKLDVKTGPIPNVVWLASSDGEEADILATFSRARVHLIPESLRDGPPRLGLASRNIEEPFRLIYVGRVVRNKGLLELVTALASIRTAVDLTIVGSEEDGPYAAEVRAAERLLPSWIRTNWVGAVTPGDIDERLSRAHGFALLTHFENFGHAIGEALRHGCPVVISDQTPWTRAIADSGAGSIVRFKDGRSASVDDVVTALRWLLEMPLDEWQQRRRAAYCVGRAGLSTTGGLRRPSRTPSV